MSYGSTLGSISANDKPIRETQIDQQQQAIRNAIDNLESLSGELLRRLEPVTGSLAIQEQKVGGPNQLPTPMVPMVPMAYQLSGFEMRIKAVNTQLEVALNRLEV